MGSRLMTPSSLVAAAVVSDPILAPKNTLFCQLVPSTMRGFKCMRLEPKRIADIGTPCGFSNSGESVGHWYADTVNLELGCAHFVPEAGSQMLPCQSIQFLGITPSEPSHHGSLVSEFIAVFVKSVG